ncbi:MAG: cytochrome c [Bryobacterales bacterium]|nr:cytochrome c [Bryobacterales bacterium]
MKPTVLFFLIASAVPSLCRGDDATAIFKTKCTACHGATGAGKAAMKGTNLLADEVKKRTDEQLTTAIASGGAAAKSSHAYEKKGVTRDQVGDLVKHVRELQKK